MSFVNVWDAAARTLDKPAAPTSFRARAADGSRMQGQGLRAPLVRVESNSKSRAAAAVVAGDPAVAARLQASAVKSEAGQVGRAARG